jgi:hypothetical protein
MSVGLIDDVVGLARRGASAVCDHATITVAAIIIAATEKMSFRIVAIKNIVADVYTDTEFDPVVLQYVSVLRCHGTLDFYGATRCVDRTSELDQHAVSGGLHDAAPVSRYRWVDKRLSSGLEPGHRNFFVDSDQAAVPGNIRRKNCRQPSFHPVTGHNPSKKYEIRPTVSKHARLRPG